MEKGRSGAWRGTGQDRGLGTVAESPVYMDILAQEGRNERCGALRNERCEKTGAVPRRKTPLAGVLHSPRWYARVWGAKTF